MVKKYALIGTGGRAIFFYTAIVKDFPKTAQLVGFCDTNQTRLDYANSRLEALGHAPVPTFLASDFDRMIAETKPDDVIVTTIDRTHNIYIVRALELGCNVITEKPMTIDVPRCREIFSAVERTGKKVTVSFNYRYAPHNTKIYELLSSGAIGEVTSVHFEWLLNTQHGADYFRRWHRDKRNSGGLLVHKSTHHFDLVNFWLQSQPETVVAMGDLKFYGRENAEKRGETKFYSRAYGSDNAKDDHFALHLDRNPQLKAMYLDAEKEDAYYRDQSVFSDGISIEDSMGVMVRYRSGAVLTYSLTAYAPWEGFRVMFNGTKGRLEVEVVEQSYVNSGGEQALEGALESRSIVLRPLFGKPVDIEIPEGSGGHGGGDPQLLNDLFGEVSGDDPFRRAASHVDGALSILTGISANQSLRTGQTVRVDDVFQIIMKLPGTAVAMDSSRSYNDLSMAVDELVNACQEGNTTLVKALLDGGLSARFLRKALEKAILNNHPSIVKLLLERGVLDQCILSSEDEWPWLLEPADTTGSLQFAAVNGKTEVVTALLAWDIRLVNCVDCLKRTALSFAVRGGHIETVRVLIAATADIMAVDAYGLTVLDHAREACNRDIVELLEAEIARVQG